MSFISLNSGIEMTARFREEKEGILASAYQNNGILPICETFDRSELDALLAKEDCESLRIYLGMDENLKVRLLLVAVDEESEDILPESPTEEGFIAEEGHRCPDTCPPGSPLNN
jgi:hypothetical protein